MIGIIKKSGERVLLHKGNQSREFVIIDATNSLDGFWYKQGSSAICYDALYSDEMGYNHYGKLKMFYLSDESKKFDVEADSYISSYLGLHRIISENKDLSKIYSFVPEFEIYYDDEKCPYIWTNNIPMRTFNEICEQILISDCRIEDALSEIIATLKSLADCIRILHENNLIHGDINPFNFGFYMRDDRILTDGLSLFDLNTLHYDWQPPKSYTPPYYDENTPDLRRPNLADIKAIGITLCKAMGLSDVQIENIKSSRKKCLSNKKIGKTIEGIVFEAELFKYKGVPCDKRINDQIIKVVMETISYNPLKIVINSCTKLRKELQLLETLLLPSCTRDELGRGLGIAIVNKALERKERVHEVFQYELYEHPLYLYENSSDKYIVLIVGFGLDAQSFLDVCIETAQSMNKKIEVHIWGTMRIKSEKEFYLRERPALNQFFLIDNHEESLTGISYGSIEFHVRSNGSIEEQIRDIVGRCKEVNYIYIAAGNDKENDEIAENFAILLDSKTIAINSQCELPERDKNGIRHVYVEMDVKNHPEYTDIERMSFNTHLVWSGTLNADLERKRENYFADYYHASCFSNVLSIKYKLHYLGIESSEDVYKAALAFKALRAADIRKMEAAEHRRWVTEKLCDGWTNMSIEDSLPYADTKDINGKRHICILRSAKKAGLIGKWTDNSTWDNADDKSLSSLDELDRMSVRLHQAYLRFARSLSSIDDLKAESKVNYVLEDLSGFNTIQRLFLEWNESKIDLLNKFVNPENKNGKSEWSIAEYELLYSRLIMELKKIDDEILRHSIQNRLKSLYSAFEPISRALRYHDYKKNDKDLIENIPFILTYTEDITMVVPMDYEILISEWENVHPSNLFSYVAAATVVNPKKLYLPYIAPQKEERVVKELILQKFQAIKDFVDRKGLRTIVNFERLKEKNSLDRVLKIGADKKLDGVILIEDNGVDVITESDKRSLADFVDTYKFDMINISFNNTKSSDWLNSIKRNVSITVRDVAGFLGRTVDMKEQPSFQRDDIKILFDIYSSDRVTWRDLCGLLKTSENKNRYIINLKKTIAKSNEELIKHIYFMPNTCYKSASYILQLLKDESIIADKSQVDIYSTDACKVTVFENGDYGLELQKIFTRQDLLSSGYKYSIDDLNGKLVLFCDGLTVEEIKVDLHENLKILSVLESLQEAGFVQIKVKKKSFDITYGSRQIKELFMEEGNLLEVYTYYKSKELNTFDDIVTGVIFHRGDKKKEENQIDCFATKGFQTVIIECKARSMGNRENELYGFKKKLRNEVLKFGINGVGLLIIDSETGVPEVKDGFKEVTVCSDSEEIADIGKIVCRQIKKS